MATISRLQRLFFSSRPLLHIAFVSLLLSGCVTTTTGGFNVDASDEQAVEDYIQLALGYYDANDLAGARRSLSNAQRLDDRNSDIYTVLALIFQREGDVELAEEHYLRAISLDRANARARNNFAAMLFGFERYEEAFEQLEQVVTDTSYDGRAIAFENLGRSALMLGKTDEAANSFRRALGLNANLYLSSLELSLLLFDQDQFAGARALFSQYLTTVDFYGIPHPPKALLAGIRIEGKFQNQKLVDDFSLLLTTLYQDSPEYQTFQEMQNAN